MPGGSRPLPAHTIKAVCAFYPPTDLVEIIPAERRDRGNNLVAALLDTPVSQRLSDARAGSPIFHVGRSSPPVFLVHGDRDKVVPLDQSQTLHAALREKNVESTLIVR